MKKIIILSIVFILGIFVSLNHALALGQMTEPIVIDNALRGEKIQQELIAVNSDKKELQVTFSAEGDVQDWTKFYLPNDLNTPLELFSLPPNGTLHVISILEVPEDIENGVYVGSFSVSNVANKELNKEVSKSNVIQKIDRKITITISDQEEVNIEKTSVIPNKFDLDKNESLSIRIIYNNQGNVRLKPQIRIKIKKDDKNIYDMIYPYPEGESAVNSKSQHEIKPLVVQTLGWENGKYYVSLEFSRDNEVLLKKDFKFSIAENNKNFKTKKIKNSYIVIIFLASLALLAIIIWQFIQKSKK